MASATGSGAATYRYDGDGRRVERIAGGAATRFLYDGGTLVAELSGANAPTLYRVPGAGFVRGGQQRYEQGDLLGSAAAVTDPWAATVGRTAYDAYGVERASTGSDRGDLRFGSAHGYVSDDATGMRLLGARYDLPALGRFLTQDPIGHEGGLNLYAYCGNSPLQKVDPKGLWPWDALLPTQNIANLPKRVKLNVYSSTGKGSDGFEPASDAEYRMTERYLLDIYHTPRGQELIDHARQMPSFVGVRIFIDYAYQNGLGEFGGTNPRILWNPSLRPWVEGPSGLFRQSARRVLAHEIGHAFSGLRDDPHSDGDPGPNIRLNENPIAASWGEPPRVRY